MFKQLSLDRFDEVFPWLGLFLVSIFVFPIFSDAFHSSKWFLVYLIGLISAIRLFQIKSIQIPRINRLTCLIGLVFLFFLGLSVFLNWPGLYQIHLLDGIVLIVIVLYSFQLRIEDRFYETGILFLRATLLVVSTVGFLQILKILPLPHGVPPVYPSSTFGFQNTTAEFLSACLCLYIAIQSFLNRFKKFDYFTIFYSLTYLSFLDSRASQLALLVSLCAGTLLSQKSISKKVSFGMMFMLTIMLTKSFGVLETFFESNNTSNEALRIETLEAKPKSHTKKKNMANRLVRLSNSLSMVKDHPFGVGPGNFEFQYVRYRQATGIDPEIQENQIIRSPHNGYVEALTEFGIIAAFLLFILIALFGLRFFKLRDKPKTKLYIPIFVYFLILVFFSFPMEVAGTFYFIVLCLGLSLKEMNQEPFIRKKKATENVSLTMCFLVIAFLSAKQIYANYLYSLHFHSLEAQKKACSLFPDMWQSCYRTIEIHLNSRESKEAYELSNQMLNRVPHFFPFIKTKGMASFGIGKYELGCELLKSYDELFMNRSSIHNEWVQFCIEP